MSFGQNLSTKRKNDGNDSRKSFWNGCNGKGNRSQQLTKWIFPLNEDTHYKSNKGNDQDSIGQDLRKVVQVLFEWCISLIRILKHTSNMTNFSIHTCIDNNTHPTTIGYV
ncbi:Uncharacterised protein [Streptococcus pneumoniae]|nr:Uncharacterised protein [Streptococcus pneumoniae]